MRCSTLLYGHEHEVGSKSTASGISGTTLFLRGDVFGTSNNRGEGGFIVDVLNSDTCQLTLYPFSSNSRGSYYMYNQSSEKHLACRDEKMISRITPAYMQQLLFDEQLNRTNSFDCYVFPHIERLYERFPTTDGEPERDILALDDFVNAIRQDRRVIIVGGTDKSIYQEGGLPSATRRSRQTFLMQMVDRAVLHRK